MLNEECGIFGIYDREVKTVASSAYYALFALQHRGQESCGIVVNDRGVFNTYKDVGIVNDVFTKDILNRLGEGQMAVGHCRYAATGTCDRVNAQPLVINHVKGRMAIAHNGSLTNAAELREELELEGSIFHTTSDSEVIAHIITRERVKCSSIEDAVNSAMKRLKGAYSLVIMSPTKLLAARDPFGFRPLCIGKTDSGGYVFASESCALDVVKAQFVRDVEPGEVVVIDKNGFRSIKDNCTTDKKALCVFEFVYFARPDSVIDGSSVHIARQRAGSFLALEHPVQADVVIGVPDSGLDAAIGYSRQSGIPYGLGFIKNKYIARTFIQPTQSQREDSVRIKLNPIGATVAGKRVILVDDSIVRGTTSAQIVKLLRDAGASEVHMRISSPPFLYPCYYGTDVDSRKMLIAVDRTVEEIAKKIGVDSLGYLSLDNITKIADRTNIGFCTSCFDGNYPVQPPKSSKKSIFENKLGEEDI